MAEMHRRRWTSRLQKLTEMRAALLAAAATVVLYLAFSQTVAFRGIEGLLLDLRFQMRGAQEPVEDIAIVLVDDKSIGEIGRWPWSRTVLADMVDTLAAAEARVIALDMLYVKPERGISGRSLDALLDVVDTLNAVGPEAAIEKFRTILPALDLGGDANPDARFAQSIARAGNVVVPFAFLFGGEGDRQTLPGLETAVAAPPAIADSAFRAIKIGDAPPRFALETTGLLAPITEIARAAHTLGHVNVALDIDASARFEYPVLAYNDAYYPSFAVQIAREAMRLAPAEMAFVAGEGLRIGPHFVPTDETMRMLANFYGPEQTFPTHSFTDVLNGRVPGETFADKIVLVGANAVGVSDVFETPFSAVVPGVERNANIVDNILSGRHLLRRNSYALLDIAAIIIGSVLIGALGRRLSSLTFSFAALAIAGAFVALNYALFAAAGMWLNLTVPLIGFLLAYSGVTIYAYFNQEERERTIREAFDLYLHPVVVEALCENPDVLSLGGEKKELTVLFSDVRNFSSIAEQLPAEQLVGLMNAYFTVMSEEILRYRGLLDKYIGDGLIAVWGAPLPMPTAEQAHQACRAALAMVNGVNSLQDQWRSHGLQRLRIGVGINTGEMIIGNMGSAKRFNYTVMGDEVNVGSRIEQYNKVMGTSIICSQQTAMAVQDEIAVRELDLVTVKGRQRLVRLYQVLGEYPLSPEWVEAIKLFEDGLYAYRRRQWKAAAAYFEEVLRQVPDDRPSTIFLLRCQRFADSPPPENWNGVAPPAGMRDAPDPQAGLRAARPAV